MQDPAYAAAFNERMNKVARYLKEHEDIAKADCDEPLYIPVAVHFEGVSIDMACAVQMALSQIDRLNADYSGENDDLVKFTDHQATWPGTQHKESCIRFCLATLNHPAGSGIAEGDYAVTVNKYAEDVENVPEWSGYINFFVRQNMAGGVLGYSPLAGNGTGDGVVIGVNYFGSVSCGGNNIDVTYSMGRTATHELGHFLSLEHTFGNDCVTDNDGLTDTPMTNTATYGCHADGESIINCVDPILWPDYMDYCDDACMYMFSKGQINQAEAYVNTSLQALLNNATTRCEDAACINFEVSLNKTNESCAGNDGAIKLVATGGAEPYEYSITNGLNISNNGNFTNLQQNNYQIVVTDQAGCEFIDSAKVTRETPPIEITNTKSAFCGDNSGSLTVKVNYDDVFNYKVEGVTGFQDTTYFPNLPGGTYTVIAKNATGCTAKTEAVIKDESDLNMVVKSVKPVNCPLFENGEIVLNVSNGEPPLVWQLNGGNRTDEGIFKNLSPGDYLVSVEDQRGCHSEKIFKIGLSYLEIGDDCPCQVFIPTAITPNGDGLNDLLDIIPSCPISDFRLEIFDRLGNSIFISTSLKEKWNGGEHSYFVEPGVYLYNVNFRWGLADNESLEVQTLKGFVTVLR